ncbi:hypothetical protein K501DRAFT_301098 [Backusella circina FSU 941]|nr:hypothetical protein K501DRAFT_301098 [Backusella circina FSU 941]
MLSKPKPLSIWILPKLLLATHKNSRRLMWAAAGGLTLWSTMAGPVTMVTVGSIASLLSWRIFKNNTTQWLDFSIILPNIYNDIHLETIHLLKKEKKLGKLVWGKVNQSNLKCCLDGIQQATILFSVYEPKGHFVCHVRSFAHIHPDGSIKITRVVLRSARGCKEVISK